MEEYMYISSSGEEKDVRNLDYQYLVNAIAKAYRNINEVLDKDEFIKNNHNIVVLQDELLKRNNNYFKEHFKNQEESEEEENGRNN